MRRWLVRGARLAVGLVLGLHAFAACEPPAVPEELARPALDSAGVCPWVVGPAMPAEVLETLQEGECVRVEAGPATRFAAPGVGCADVDEFGVRCAILRPGEPQLVRWNDRLVAGEHVPSAIFSGEACRCPK